MSFVGLLVWFCFAKWVFCLWVDVGIYCWGCNAMMNWNVGNLGCYEVLLWYLSLLIWFYLHLHWYGTELEVWLKYDLEKGTVLINYTSFPSTTMNIIKMINSLWSKFQYSSWSWNTCKINHIWSKLVKIIPKQRKPFSSLTPHWSA